jgi:nicotinate-nucleotide adenylyltransferase
MKKVALYGGSFNPSTSAHRKIGLDILDQLPVDEVWYLVSPQNPFKSTEGMASFKDRLAMARINLAGHPRLIVQDIETAYLKELSATSIQTADTLRMLTRDFPDHHFVWVMGADNLQSFHTWGDADYIAAHFPLIVIPRKGHTEEALRSITAQKLPRLTPHKAPAQSMNRGLYVLATDENDIAASKCKSELALGKAPQAMRPSVASYALKNKIYSCERI